MATKRKNSPLNGLLANGSMDIPFFLLLIVIVSVGLVMLFSASYTYSYYNRDGDSTYIFRRQIIFTILGLVGMYVVSRIRYEYFKVFAFMVLQFL